MECIGFLSIAFSSTYCGRVKFGSISQIMLLSKPKYILTDGNNPSVILSEVF